MKGDEPASRGWWLTKIRTIHDRMSHPGITGIWGKKKSALLRYCLGRRRAEEKAGRYEKRFSK
jgi:hypothetical protein